MSQEKGWALSAVAEHNKKDDLWIAIHGKVYNVTKYTEEHPGGLESFLEVGGKDATSAFEDVGHSADARETMEQFCIGNLEEGSQEEQPPKRRVVKPEPQLQTPRNKEHQASNYLLVTAIYTLLACVSALGLGIALTRALGRNDFHVYVGGFWGGALISVAFMSLIGIALFFRLERAMDAYPDFRSFPAHRMPTYQIAEVTKNKGVLNPQEYQAFPLVRKDQVSPNVFKFIFDLPSPASILGLPIGQHVAIRANVNGKTISRSYTPISNNTDKGELRLAIKIYPDGKLTGGCLKNLKIGDKVEFRGPKGTMRYRKGRFGHLGMIAGGTGITPMYQLIRAICEDKTDSTNISLVLGNTSEGEILMRPELDNFQRQCPDKLKIWYMLDHPPKRWPYGQGFITKEILEQRMPPTAHDTQILLCGPPGLVKGCKKALDALGFPKPNAVSKATDQVFLF